jgi:glycosyltransferase involved in cell wall biosynthesis
MSDSRPLISAIITTHNRKEMMRQAIESVLNQVPCGEAVEVIVVDDNSSDGTREVIAEYDRARYLRAREGTPAGTRNVGIAGSTGSWLAFLDDDDVWLPQKLQVFVAALRNNPEARVFFSTAYICDHNLTRGPLWLGPQDLDTSAMYASVLLDPLTPSVTMIHREVFERVGLFDPKAFAPRIAICSRAPLAPAFASVGSRSLSCSIAAERSSTARSSRRRCVPA